jgi:hypothetical protein
VLCENCCEIRQSSSTFEGVLFLTSPYQGVATCEWIIATAFDNSPPNISKCWFSFFETEIDHDLLDVHDRAYTCTSSREEPSCTTSRIPVFSSFSGTHTGMDFTVHTVAVLPRFFSDQNVNADGFSLHWTAITPEFERQRVIPTESNEPKTSLKPFAEDILAGITTTNRRSDLVSNSCEMERYLVLGTHILLMESSWASRTRSPENKNTSAHTPRRRVRIF